MKEEYGRFIVPINYGLTIWHICHIMDIEIEPWRKIQMNKFEFGSPGSGSVGTSYNTSLSFDGLHTSGEVSCRTLTQTSDSRLKKDFNNITEQLLKAYMEIPLYTFKWKDDNDIGLNIGVKAQDVIKALENNEIDPNKYNIVNHIKEDTYNFNALGINYQSLNALTMFMSQKHERQLELIEEKIKKIESIK